MKLTFRHSGIKLFILFPLSVQKKAKFKKKINLFKLSKYIHVILHFG